MFHLYSLKNNAEVTVASWQLVLISFDKAEVVTSVLFNMSAQTAYTAIQKFSCISLEGKGL